MIREAKTADLKQIQSIMRYYVDHTMTNWSESVLKVRQLKHWLREHQYKNWPIQVAVNELNQVLGYGCLSDFRKIDGYRRCVENTVYVKPEIKGAGIGGLLMNALLFQARLAGIKAIIAVIDSENKESIQFHQRYDFYEVCYMKNVGFKHQQWRSLIMLQYDVFDV